MDPFIESQKWEDFHTRFITTIGDTLVSAVRPKYVVEVERRVYLETRDPSTPVQSLIADAAIFEGTQRFAVGGESAGGVAVASETFVEPKVCTLPYIEEHREVFLTIRRGTPAEVVTVIELLSPTNKRRGTDGHEAYTEKRIALMKTKAHLVELDLLRGGERMLVSDPPAGDYFAIVSRAARRPLADVYGWPLMHRLPIIPVPLAHGDPDVPLDLQAVFNLVYGRAGYDYSLNYHQSVAPLLTEVEANCLQEKLG
jgi:hypothetical protein